MLTGRGRQQGPQAKLAVKTLHVFLVQDDIAIADDVLELIGLQMTRGLGQPCSTISWWRAAGDSRAVSGAEPRAPSAHHASAH